MRTSTGETLKSPDKSLFKKIMELRLTEPRKSFRKMGVTDDQDRLTTEGNEVFVDFLFEKYGEEFYSEIVKKLVEEEEKTAKKNKRK